MPKYWIKIDDAVEGPYDARELRFLQGVDGVTLVSPEAEEGAETWSEARQIEELRKILGIPEPAAEPSPPSVEEKEDPALTISPPALEEPAPETGELPPAAEPAAPRAEELPPSLEETPPLPAVQEEPTPPACEPIRQDSKTEAPPEIVAKPEEPAPSAPPPAPAAPAPLPLMDNAMLDLMEKISEELTKSEGKDFRALREKRQPTPPPPPLPVYPPKEPFTLHLPDWPLFEKKIILRIWIVLLLLLALTLWQLHYLDPLWLKARTGIELLTQRFSEKKETVEVVKPVTETPPPVPILEEPPKKAPPPPPPAKKKQPPPPTTKLQEDVKKKKLRKLGTQKFILPGVPAPDVKGSEAVEE